MAKVGSDKSSIVQQIPMACADERAAVEFLEKMRWDDEPSCPRCGDTNVYQMKERATGERNARYLWRCRGCGKQYTVRVGTVMEDSPIPLRHWCYAFWAACASKKGVSALQIKRQTGLTYKSALFLMHRIRLAMTDSHTGPLNGEVEADETWVGGRPRPGNNQARVPGGKQRGYKRNSKVGVVALVERNGNARTFVPTEVKGANLSKIVREEIDRSARLHTDESHPYKKVGQEFDGGHYRVTHSRREYWRQDGVVEATTNTVESFFSLLKRGVIGTFHNVSREHLHRYCAEFEFRWNHRKVDDGARVRAAIQGAEGKRLMYRHP